jgi:hypothetical protein
LPSKIAATAFFSAGDSSGECAATTAANASAGEPEMVAGAACAAAAKQNGSALANAASFTIFIFTSSNDRAIRYSTLNSTHWSKQL